MNLQIGRKNNTAAAVVESGTPLITDVQSALELMMTVKYETGCTRFAVNKEALTEDFFILSTGVAGEVLQKFGREVCHIRRLLGLYQQAPAGLHVRHVREQPGLGYFLSAVRRSGGRESVRRHGRAAGRPLIS